MANSITEVSGKKPLGLWTLTALVVGNMIGSGIFLLPADLAKLGRVNMLAWGITVLGAFFLAIILSRSSQLVRQNGGPYAYARNGLGNFVGFQTVYNHWIAIWVGNLALVLALVSYLSMFWPILLQPVLGALLGIFIIWLLTLVNITGVGNAGKLQLITVILKLTPIVLLVICGIWFIHPAYFKEIFYIADQSHPTLSSTASLTLWSFIGVESATIPYDSVQNPSRNIPIATLSGVIIAALVYILSATVIMGIVPQQDLVGSASPFISAAETVFGSFGKWFMILGAAISCFGCINGWTMLHGQVAMAAADNNLFPAIFGLRNKRNVPFLGLTITAILESIILLLTLDKETNAQFQLIVLMASLAALIPYLYSSLASLVIFKRHTEMASIKDKILFLLASLAAVYAFWMISIASARVLFYGSILVFTSALLYGWGYGDAEEEAEKEET